MATVRTIEATPADKSGMTVNELRQFVLECDEAGTPGDTRVKAQVTFGGGLKSLKAAGRFTKED